MTCVNSQSLPRMLIFVVLLLVVLVPPRVSAQTENELITSVAWSDDGALVAAVGSRRSPNSDFTTGILYVLDMSSGAIRWQVETPNPFYSEPHFSPDGNRLAVARCQFIDIYDSVTGELLHTHFADFADPPTCVREIDWRADGTRYITAAGEDITVWDAITYEPLHRLNRGEVWGAAFQPGGDLIAVGGSGGIELLPPTLDTGGQPFGTFTIRPAYYIAALEWNASGTRLAFTTHSSDVLGFRPSELGVYDLSQHAEVLHMSLDSETAYGLDWSADEQQVVSQSRDGRVRVWDLENGTQIAEYSSTPRLYAIDAAFSPFGGVLAYGRSLEDTLMTQRTAQTQSDLVAFVVPDPSPERLQAIADLCGAPLTVDCQLDTAIAAADMSSLIAQVESLPTGTIPPACAADLIAVAEAIQSQ